MEVMLRNAEGNLSPRDREYASKKLGKLDRYFTAAQKVEMVHREEKHGHRIEVTVFADGLTVRGEETDESLRAAIDNLSEKLENRLRRMKGRLIKARRRKGLSMPPALDGSDLEPEPEPDGFVLKEHKKFLLKPMSTEEAALQMDLLGHPFFVYRNESTMATEVLYKRKDGGYGLLTPDD